MAFPVFQGSKRSELGSGTLLMPCVIHWGSKAGDYRACGLEIKDGGAPVRRRIAGARRSAMPGPIYYCKRGKEVPRVCVELKRGARAAVSCCSTPATAELRRQITGDVFPPLGWSTEL